MKTAFCTLILWLSICAAAMADIEVSPLRHVITIEDSVAIIAVSNPSRRVLDARVSWIDLTATKTGYAPATKNARQLISAAPYLIVSPAFFQLEPGGRIDITVKLREGVQPPKGERRSHLLIETAASRTPIRKASDSGLQVDIGLSISTPVILRNGGHAEARIGDTKLLRDDDGMLLLATTIEPLGKISTFGRLTATFKPIGKNSTVQALGIRDNVAGYLDAPNRLVEIPLGYEALGAGELTLRYEGMAEYAGRIFHERKFDIEPPE